MLNTIVNRFTPQDKLGTQANKFGNQALITQQGTTRIIWDMLPLDNNTNEYRFFENANSRTFPFTNLTKSQLEVGESMIMSRAYLSIITIDPDNGNEFLNTAAITSNESFNSGQYSFETANQTVLKPIPLISWTPTFNKHAQFDEHNMFGFDTQLSIPPLVDFIARVRFSQLNNISTNQFLRLTIEGVGTILNMKGTQ